MKTYIAKTPIGVLAVDASGKLQDFEIFPKDAKKVAKKLKEECSEEKTLSKRVPNAARWDKALDISKIAEDIGFCKANEIQKWLMDVNKEVSKASVRKVFKGEDKLIIQAIRYHEVLDASSNRYSELLRDWYSVNFPELSTMLPDNREFAKCVADVGRKEDIDEKKLTKSFGEGRKVRGILKVIPDSVGGDVNVIDMKEVRDMAEGVLDIYERRARNEDYINKIMMENVPNIARVATPLLGAKLIELAGSMERLAILPGSTIQVLGAQRAMFRFMKTKKSPPKYGILYAHPLVSSAPRKDKGRIARSLGAKISIAAKLDFNGGEFAGDLIYAELETRAKTLKEKQ
jgi:nucleolar protein 56